MIDMAFWSPYHVTILTSQMTRLYKIIICKGVMIYFVERSQIKLKKSTKADVQQILMIPQQLKFWQNEKRIAMSSYWLNVRGIRRKPSSTNAHPLRKQI